MYVYLTKLLFSLLCVWPNVLSLLKAVDDFDNQLSAGGRSAQLVKAVDSRLRKQTQELHVRCGKVSAVCMYMLSLPYPLCHVCHLVWSLVV